MEEKLIVPRKLQGFWELMPKEQICFSSLLSKIENVFKTNCFVPLDTPVLEYSEVLLAKSGGETDKEVYRFSKGSTDMCMRYDLTVPLARFVSMHKEELSFPFKRYQIGKVYRGERPQKGRYREFYQCDADIIGNGELSLVADAECIRLLEKCFEALNLDVEVRVSSRKILTGYIEEIGKANVMTDVLIVLDKLDKLPEEEAKQQLSDIGINGKTQENLINLIKTTGNFDSVSKKLSKLSKNATFAEGLADLKEVDSYLQNMGCKNVVYDLSIIRGHNYYTSIVFEGFLAGKKNLGAVAGGGRFDNLTGYFSDKKMPGVGMSVGITRLFSLLMQENYFNLEDINEIDCAVINFDETLNASLALVEQLRKNGVNAEIFYENKSFKSKMKEANRRQVKYVLIVGEDEVKSQKYMLKNMQTSEQKALSVAEIIKTIKEK